jgi:hypothetical protein
MAPITSSTASMPPENKYHPFTRAIRMSERVVASFQSGEREA